jgi:dipeptidyl aminopeptidase/acylaminoacyl peptidase
MREPEGEMGGAIHKWSSRTSPLTWLMRVSPSVLIVVMAGISCIKGEIPGGTQTSKNSNETRKSESTFDFIANRATISDIQVSPDGVRTAFLYFRGRPVTDEVEFTLSVVDNRLGEVTEVARYALPAARAMADLDVPRPTAAGFRWSQDGQSLAYLLPGSHGVEVVLWHGTSVRSEIVVAGHDEVQLSEDGSDYDGLRLVTRDELRLSLAGPPDRALRIKDGYRFFGPLKNPKMSRQFQEQAWILRWSTGSFQKVGDVKSVYELGEPREISVAPPSATVLTGTTTVDSHEYRQPGGKLIVRSAADVSRALSPHAARLYRYLQLIQDGGKRPPVTITRPSEDQCHMKGIGWEKDGRYFFFLEQCEATTSIVKVDANGVEHTVVKVPALLDARGDRPEREISPGGLFAVLARSSSFSAEDLISVDLESGEVRSLVRPNDGHQLRVSARSVVMTPSDDIFKARLYLPGAPATGRLPLVVTLYHSGPGLETSTGDEIPILALVESGIAVMTVDTRSMVDGFGNGDSSWEVARVERPRIAIEQLIQRVTADYGVDPSRVGLAGLSYGTEIAMYCYWKSERFRTISTAGGSPSPSWVFLGGIGYASRLAQRGLSDATEPIEPVWKFISAALNAREELPPLLWQTPDSERVATTESWYRLRKAGAPVEWWDYPDETHQKFSPADRWWVQRRNLDWFRFWLQDYEDPDASKADQYVRWREFRELHHARSSAERTARGH